MKRLAAALLFLWATPASADTQDDADHGVVHAFRAGADLVKSVPMAAILDGGWSLTLQAGTLLTNRTWDGPYPQGLLAHFATRILYGTTWTTMLGLESLVVVLAHDGRFDWLAEASYRTDWVVGFDLPSCPRSGAYGGCGVGVGSFSTLRVRPVRSHLWYEVGGGWIQQRIANDEARTLAESSWVLSPLTVVYEASTDRDAPVAVRALAGPGVYFGIHAAHLHPTTEAKSKPDVPWTEMYVLDGGLGAGGRVEVEATLARHLTLDGELTIAPFFVGGPRGELRQEIAPLAYPREGTSVWRRLTFGIGYDDPKSLPFKATIGASFAELSERSIDLVGSRSIQIRFDVPLRPAR